MRKNIIILFFCIALIMGAASWASAIDDILGIPDLRFNGYLKNATAMRIQHDYDLGVDRRKVFPSSFIFDQVTAGVRRTENKGCHLTIFDSHRPVEIRGAECHCRDGDSRL